MLDKVSNFEKVDSNWVAADGLIVIVDQDQNDHLGMLLTLEDEYQSRVSQYIKFEQIYCFLFWNCYDG